MDLLDRQIWDFALPWGNIINPDTEREICIYENLVSRWPDGTFHFGCLKAPRQGWKRDKDWNIVYSMTQWSVGAVVAKEEYRTHFGTYRFVFRLPNFRGSWPAIWLIDLHPAPPKGDGMGMPPEIDIFEQFRKDGFLSRFHMEHAFQQGPTYQQNTVISATYWKFVPLDLSDIELIFTWTPGGISWKVNGKTLLTVPPGTPNYPLKPMNLLMNAGLEPNWRPDTGNFTDFIIRQATYTPM